MGPSDGAAALLASWFRADGRHAGFECPRTDVRTRSAGLYGLLNESDTSGAATHNISRSDAAEVVTITPQPLRMSLFIARRYLRFCSDRKYVRTLSLAYCYL